MNPHAEAIQTADLNTAHWHLTGMGYSDDEADRILAWMIADRIDYTSGQAMDNWLHNNRNLAPRP